MTKAFVMLTIILVLLGIGWAAYLKEGNKDFVDSLPKPPHRVQEDPSQPMPVVSEVPEQGIAPEVSPENSDRRDNPDPHSKSGVTSKVPHAHETLQPEIHSHAEIHSHEKLPEPKTQEEPPQTHQKRSKMSPEEFAQHLADQFRVKTKGKHLEEIKTVQRFLPRIMSREKSLSLEEKYEFQKALTRLNPTAKNKEGLRVMEERIKRHRDYPPGVPRPSEHVRDKTAEESDH